MERNRYFSEGIIKDMVADLKKIIDDRIENKRTQPVEDIYVSSGLDIKITYLDHKDTVLVDVNRRQYWLRKISYMCEKRVIDRVIEIINLDMELDKIVW